MSRLILRVMGYLERFAGPTQRDLTRAAAAELAAIDDPRARRRWLVGTLSWLLREILRRRLAAPLATVIVVAALLWADRSTSDDAGQSSMLVLLLGAGALGLMMPRRPWLPGVIVGCSVAAAHLAYQVVGVPSAQSLPAHPATAPLTLLILVVPATVAAYLGAGLRRLLAPDRGGRRQQIG